MLNLRIVWVFSFHGIDSAFDELLEPSFTDLVFELGSEFVEDLDHLRHWVFRFLPCNSHLNITAHLPLNFPFCETALCYLIEQRSIEFR